MQAEPCSKFWTRERIQGAFPVNPPNRSHSVLIEDEQRQTAPYISVGILLFTFGDTLLNGSAYVAKIPGKDKWKNVIFTAGHNLVKNDKEIAKNICFVPAMLSDFSCPFGMFDAVDGGLDKAFVVPQSFCAVKDDPADDIGAVRLQKCNGQDVGDLVPLLDILTDQQYNKDTVFTAIGYSMPGEMRQSVGTLVTMILDPQGDIIKKGGIGGGGSGGPWLLNDEGKVSGSTATGNSQETLSYSPNYTKELITEMVCLLEVAEIM